MTSRIFTQRFASTFRIFGATFQRKFAQGANSGLKIGRNVAFFTGGSTTFALSLFGSSSDKLKPGTEPSLELTLREADAFYESYMIDNCWGILRRFERTSNPELLWRLARVLTEKAKLTANKEEKKTLLLEALEYAEKALANETATGCFGAHKWYAIIINYVGELEGTKSQIRRSYDMKVHLERALEINPLDATTWHILGVWHFTFADMPTYQRLAAKAIFGTPPSSTYEEALRHFERAETIQPGFYKANNFYLGEVYDRMGQKDKAIEHYKKAFHGPIITKDDHDSHEKALNRLKKFGFDEKKLLDRE
uniref:Regulator of microtubule dynamics protein 1 n=1 Tax=Panagrolaimus sp. JU765 TaxID=591449 RepID=A0AC34QZK1_9BILA